MTEDNKSSTKEHGSSKRKYEDEQGGVPLDSPPKSDKKQKIAKKPKQRAGEDFDDQHGLNLAISHMGPKELVGYVDSRTKQFEPKISDMELEDQRIPVVVVRDTTSWEQTRVLESLADFLEKFGEDLNKAPKEAGSPHTIVVAGAGLRAADITRVLRKFQTKDAIIAKLFAKHIKLKESIELCKKKRINIGVGTPQRIIELLENGCLSTKSLKRLVIDASHVDQKRRGLLEMKDTHGPLIKLLNLPVLQDKFDEDDPIEIIFY